MMVVDTLPVDSRRHMRLHADRQTGGEQRGYGSGRNRPRRHTPALG